MAKIATALAAAGFLGFIAGPAAAATFVVNITLDLDQPGYGQYVLDTPVVAGVGDTIDLTITFADDRALELGYLPTVIGLGLLTDGPERLLELTTQYHFIDVTGPVIPDGAPQNILACCGAYGFATHPEYATSEYGTMSFKGIREVIKINGQRVPLTNAPDPTPRTYNRGYFYVAGFVPEPAVWLTLVGGFGVLGGALRARRRPATAAA